ncbi:glycosyltransferase family 4 protein [Fundidesulfovibrio putealis]|uniref:glycosyltransferase family 4 protein n=1 Tax=Fundidesulfovibrio putealis TaxID=270496 RepID=UPI00041991AC|nr:glycosyltransferase family 4 protein [Fundidesulfovibrio putealis]
MRLLVVSPNCPWPPDEGGNIRIVGLLRELARTHEVTLVTAVRKPEDREGVRQLRGMLHRVVAPEIMREPWRKCLDMAASYLTLTPYLGVIADAPALRLAVAEAAPGQDAAQGEFVTGARLIAGLSCFKVMDAHNVEADILLGNARRARGPLRKLHHFLQALFMRRFEEREAARMDAILTCSDADREHFLRRNPTVLTVPNAVEAVHDREAPDGKDVVFVGLMSYLANVEGICWFHETIWPLVKAREPEARLWIVGKNPRPEVSRLACADVMVTGSVPDVAGYYRQARVFVCPLRVGSGTRLKILEAFSWGVPVVSTPLGCSGIEARPGEHMLVAGSPEDFAQAVVSVLDDDALAQRLGRAGRDLVGARYTWARVAQTLNEKVYKTCA